MRNSKRRGRKHTPSPSNPSSAANPATPSGSPAPIPTTPSGGNPPLDPDFTTPSPNASTAPNTDTPESEKPDWNTRGARILGAIDNYTPDDIDDFTLQAERKYGLRSPAAILDTTKSISDMRKGGQRRFFERTDGQTNDGALRKGLDAAYLASQAAVQLTPDEDADENSGTTATRKLIHGTADIIKMAGTAEKKPTLQHENIAEAEPPPDIIPEAPQDKPFVKPSKHDIEQYKRVKSRQAAMNGQPPVLTVPKDMSKEEMREAIRQTNRDITAQGRSPQSIQHDVRRQRQSHRTTQRSNYRHKRQTGLHHNRSQTAQNAVSTDNTPASVSTVSQPAPSATASAPVTTPEVATPSPAVPTVTQPHRNNGRQAGSKRPTRHSKKTPQLQGQPIVVPLTPLQHGTPPSLSSQAPNNDSKTDKKIDNKSVKNKPDNQTEKQVDNKQAKKSKPKADNPDNSKKKESKLKHDDKKDKDSKLNFADNQQSNTFLAQGSRHIQGKIADKIHSEISNAEKDFGNTGLETVHKAETAAEKAHSGHGKIKKLHHYIKSRHTRRATKAKVKALRHEGKLAQQALNKDPAYKGKPLSKAIQKRRIKRQYAQAMKAAKSGKTLATSTKATATTAKTAALALKTAILKAKAIAAAKAVIILLGKVIAAIILFIILLTLIVSCVSMVGGGFAAIIEALSYQADMDDMTTYSVYMTELQLNLKEDIHDAMSPDPPADEVVLIINVPAPGTSQTLTFPPSLSGHGGVFYNGSQLSQPSTTVAPGSVPSLVDLRALLPDISHCPFELMAYLTIVHGDFSGANMNEVLQDLFDEVFQVDYSDANSTFPLTVPVEHWVTDDEGFPEQVPPFTTIINVPLNTRTVMFTVNGTISDVIRTRLEDRYDGSNEDNPYLAHFEFLMETRGLRQFVGSPFENDWTGAVTSIFGYRLHPITGNREMHTGIDVGKPTGTPLLSGLDGGIVVTAGDMGGYGLTVIIEHVDTETGLGVRVLYAHMDTIDVSVGDVVALRDVIGAVGQTGTATGAHLHLEISVSENSGVTWRRINPIFFLEPFPTDNTEPEETQ